MSRSAVSMWASIKPELSFRVEIERTPERAIDQNDEQAHHGDAKHNAMEIAGIGLFRNIGAEALRYEAVVSPTRHFSNDARIPRSAGGGDCAGHIVGKDGGDRDPPPPQPAANAKIGAGRSQLGGDGHCSSNDVEEDVPLRAKDHQRAQPNIGIEL